MHNPRLKRWLHRIDRPTLLLWGDFACGHLAPHLTGLSLRRP
jgi:pimeloyl-ACP methyl ester carboxylesterase